MSLDMVMMALVVAGLALSITYFYAAMRLSRQYARREREKASAQRKLHAERYFLLNFVIGQLDRRGIGWKIDPAVCRTARLIAA